MKLTLTEEACVNQTVICEMQAVAITIKRERERALGAVKEAEDQLRSAKEHFEYHHKRLADVATFLNQHNRDAVKGGDWFAELGV